MDVNTTGFTSPLANANFGGNVPPQVELLLDALKGVTFWTGLWTLLALAVVYDQCTLPSCELEELSGFGICIDLLPCSELPSE